MGGLEMLPNCILPWHHEHAKADLSALPNHLVIKTSFTPKSKPVEGWFNRSQKLRQAFWGYAGRDQRKEPQEKVVKLIGACNRGTENGFEHFMTMDELKQAYGQSIFELNSIRMEGEVFSGIPAQLWEEWTTKAGFEQLTMAPSTAWMYKSMWAQGFVHGPFIRVSLTDELTRRRYKEVWSSPCDLHEYDRKHVLVYWDPDKLDAPAIVIDPRSGEYLCQAEHFDKPGAFLDGDMTGLEVVHDWERFNVTKYGRVKDFIPSLQKPEGVRERQAEARKSVRRQALDMVAAAESDSSVSSTGHGPNDLPQILSRRELLEAAG
jgi:hypothetical protein